MAFRLPVRQRRRHGHPRHLLLSAGAIGANLTMTEITNVFEILNRTLICLHAWRGDKRRPKCWKKSKGSQIHKFARQLTIRKSYAHR
jgi:hypothetical protein